MRKLSMSSNANYYLLLIVLVIFTAGLSFLLMPLILVGTPLTVYAISITTGIVFGLFITLFVMDLDQVTHHHHAGIWLIVLFGAIINFVVISLNKTFVSGNLLILSPGNPSSPLIAALFFAFGFFLPYTLFLYHQHRSEGKK